MAARAPGRLDLPPSMDPGRLKSLPLFRGVSEEDLRKIATLAAEVSVEQGKHLVNEGDYSYELMAIEEGTAEVLRGGEHLAELGPGQFFGEIGLLERERRNATVVAKTPMRLITFTSWDLRRMEKTTPQALEEIRQVMEQRRGQG
jgi:CRP/FNR family transcriptional regulator, cyclic AMP receptor protein